MSLSEALLEGFGFNFVQVLGQNTKLGTPLIQTGFVKTKSTLFGVTCLLFEVFVLLQEVRQILSASLGESRWNSVKPSLETKRRLGETR